jgi:hypothetical protein
MYLKCQVKCVVDETYILLQEFTVDILQNEWDMYKNINQRRTGHMRKLKFIITRCHTYLM